MKTNILILLTLISMSCFSQTIGGLVLNSVITTNPIQVEFRVYQEDSVSMNLYDSWGNPIIKVLPKDLYKAGTYKLEYTKADSLKNGTYMYLLKSSNKSIAANVFFNGFKGSSKAADFITVTYIDSIQVYDTVKVSVNDTTNILIIDTLNCTKTSTNLRDYESIPISESLVFHDYLTIAFSGVDKLMLYDLTGKCIRRVKITGTLINMQDLQTGTYVGLFYENGDIVKTIKMIKE